MERSELLGETEENNIFPTRSHWFFYKKETKKNTELVAKPGTVRSRMSDKVLVRPMTHRIRFLAHPSLVRPLTSFQPRQRGWAMEGKYKWIIYPCIIQFVQLWLQNLERSCVLWFCKITFVLHLQTPDWDEFVTLFCWRVWSNPSIRSCSRKGEPLWNEKSLRYSLRPVLHFQLVHRLIWPVSSSLPQFFS